ncbi:MAG: recombinase family protein [Marivivens sp.]|uniref:recombinase family protein n=1 Tax=Marivivens sp. TaxID=1978374 RepID=UPI00179E346E|nr:recombinase family protein [Marivivens sp.]NVJ95659.1 recombinase family protein [Marivivens sp.]
MAYGKFISYMRVSTAKQGKSGLGLEAQREAVSQYLNGGDWELVQEFVEVESGRKNNRPELEKAIRLCQAVGATLVVAKFDRLSRDAHFLLGLQKAGIKFVAADNPQANELTVGILALVAQNEAEAISTRTKAALAAAKARGQQLGAYSKEDKTKFVGRTGTRDDCLKAAEGKKAKADDMARKVYQLIKDYGLSPDEPASSIARFLTSRGIQTPSGRSTVWQTTTVQRLKARWG